jgi:carbon-monoxide dehydrogenase small subunit
MRVEQQISISRPPAEVWALLCDVPAVVTCIPGAELGESLGDDRYRGTFNLKIGPLSAKIEGEGKVTRDDAARSGHIEGKGVDRRGGSRVSAAMSYKVVEAPGGSQVDIAADLTLAGQLSQIGRTGLIEDIAKQLTQDFSIALTQRLSANAPGAESAQAAAPPAPAAFDAGRALRESLWKRLMAWLARLFNRN